MRRTVKRLKQQIAIGMLGGTAGAIGERMPGTTGLALQRTSTSLAGFAAPLATVTGAAMVFEGMESFPKIKRRRR